MKSVISTLILILSIVFVVRAQPEKKLEKLSAEEIIARHIASIGEKDAIAAAGTRVMMGEGKLVSKVGGGPSGFILNGTGQFASTGRNILFAIDFSNPTYAFEKVAFNGEDVTYGLPSGRPTLLVNYIRTQTSIMKDGLFGGALSAAWPLLDIKAGQKIKVEAAGTTKVNDKPVYRLKYSSGRTGQLKVSLFFDADTFHHVRTEYEYTIEPSIGRSSTDTQSTSRVERYKLTEDFSDFTRAGNLSLPLTYQITIVNEGQLALSTGTTIREWTLKIANVYFDQKLVPEVFKVS
jgi:hypothetical protein